MATRTSTKIRSDPRSVRLIIFRNPWRHILGLMFRRPGQQTAYLFDFCCDVRHAFHTWFVFWPIDLYLLDAEGRVVEERRGFRPFSYHAARKSYRYAVETREGLWSRSPSFQPLLARGGVALRVSERRR